MLLVLLALVRGKDACLQAIMCGGPHLSGLMPIVWMPQLPYAGELALAACCADALAGATGMGTRRTWAEVYHSLCLALGDLILAHTSRLMPVYQGPLIRLSRSCAAM